MSAFNVVRFRVKPGREAEFLDAHRDGKAAWPGLAHGVIIRTGERTYAVIGAWPDMATLADGRGPMVATLNSFREVLEDLGGGMGVTDAVSGPVVLDLRD